ncbi:MAG: Xaa-Pro peptidase family protein [bacterium]|nr:Xaa-Pro peptidase family protein [bacterium]
MKSDARLVVGASTKNEDLLWATRFFAPDTFIFLETSDRKVIVVNPLEYDRARSESSVFTVLLDTELRGNIGKQRLPINESVLLLLREFNVLSVEVSSQFPASTYAHLLENGIAVTFSDPLFPERAIKTDDELADIVHAQKSMEEVFSEMLSILALAEIRDGKVWWKSGLGGAYVTSEMLRTIFDTKLMERNCVCDATIIASGHQAANPHCMGYGPLFANTPIVFDMFPRSRKKWYWSDMTRTVVKGKLTTEARAMYDAVYDAQARALEMVRPGIDGYDIHSFVKQELEGRGFRTGQTNGKWEGFFHGTGHGVGLEIHEPPSIGNSRGHVLKPGHVITIEPGLYYDGIGGVRIEDTVLVTESGYRNLASTSKELIEIP